MSDQSVYIGRDWRQIVAGWPEPRRRRHAEIAAGLAALGWQDDASRYLAFERISDEIEAARIAAREAKRCKAR